LNTPNFSDIYTLYFEDVYKYLLALCHDEELAEELAQDTFFKAMKSYENFRGENNDLAVPNCEAFIFLV
jgi:DNA-directed RNA polymerase specialized sigma24 family protein